MNAPVLTSNDSPRSLLVEFPEVMMPSKRTPGLILASMLCSSGLSGGAEPLDPVAVLRADPSVRTVEPVVTHATGQVVRVRLRSSPVELYVMFSNEATTAAQAQTVRQIAVSLNVPSRHSLTSSALEAWTGVASKLAGMCLNQSVSALPDAMRAHLNKALPDHALLRRFSSGVTVEVVPSSPWATSGSSVQVTIPLGARSPRCVMPGARGT